MESGFSFMILLLFVKCKAVEKFPTDCFLPYFPRNYVAYHLDESQTINIDGKLEELAWREVARTEEFVGMQVEICHLESPSNLRTKDFNG